MVHTTSSTGFPDELSDILLVSSNEWIYTEAELHLLFGPYEPVEKVLIIQEFPALQALVKFQSEQCAISAWNSLRGSLQIQFYKLRDQLVSRGVGTGFDSELKGSTPHVPIVCNKFPSANSSSGSKGVSSKPLEQKTMSQGSTLTHIGMVTESGILGTSSSPIHVVREPRKKTGIIKCCKRLVPVFAVLLLIWLLYGIRKDMRHSELQKQQNSSESEVIKNQEVVLNQEVQPSRVANITFNDVKGVDEAKAELEEIVYYLKDPERFTRLGGKLPKGVLLTGPPGTGKTMLAEAVAAQARVPFFSARGSEFVGLGVQRVRELFSAAKEKSPCVVFIDEIDAFGGAHNAEEPQHFRMTLNQLLTELDGVAKNEGVVVIAATNFPETLDKALVRPGRFDRQVVVPLPDVEGRRQILEVHMSKVLGGDDANLAIIARGTPGFSGAELANLVNSAAIRAASTGAEVVSMSHLEYAKDKIIMGSERKSAVLSDESRRRAVVHETGHALVAIHTDGALPVHKVTIVPRGRSHGMVQFPDSDETNFSRKQMLARLAVLMGGVVGEEIGFGDREVTSRSSADLEEATNLARDMVTKYGMSLKIGHIYLSYNGDGPRMTPGMQHLVEEEMRVLLEQANDNATSLLYGRFNEFKRVGYALMEHETLTGNQIKALLARQE